MGVKRSRCDSLSSSEDPSTPFSREQSVDVKIVHLDTDSNMSVEKPVMRCSLPPHEPLTFASFEEHEIHHQQVHMNRCSECHKNFPDERFLLLHIAEYHDPIVAGKREKGERTYACLVPACDRLCSTPQKRRLHCIDKHQFPPNYDFIIIKDGIDRRHSMLQSTHRRRSSTLTSTGGTARDTGRRRGGSPPSQAIEKMELVQDIDSSKDHDEEVDPVHSSPRSHLRLRGRGGFGRRPSLQLGRGQSEATVSAQTPATSATSEETTVDPMDGLTSKMSSLQFIPKSVRATKGRGRGRGA